MSDETLAIECDLTALSDSGRERVIALADKLFPMAREVRDLSDGYALGYHDASPELFSDLAEFIALHSICCAFVRQGMVADPGRGTVWLEFTGGPPGAKEAIASDLARLLSDDLVAAGLTGSNRGVTIRRG
jgi:hypothetical protein